MKKNKTFDVAIIMGSESDFKIMKGAADILKKLNITYQTQIISAHRTPKEMVLFSENAKKNDFKVIIAGAGGAAHLPGMVASLTTLPVIGVPVNVTQFKGLDALLSIVQMPKGVPVATMAVDNSFNAGLFAARILAIENKTIEKKLSVFALGQKIKVQQMSKRIK